MAEQNKEWRVYIIGDLRTWTNPQEYEESSKLERFDNFEDAKKRFNELRNLPYNSEKALNNDGTPSARLALGQAKIEGMTTISVNKADKAKLDSIKSELVKKLNPEKPKQTEKKDAPAPKRSRR